MFLHWKNLSVWLSLSTTFLPDQFPSQPIRLELTRSRKWHPVFCSYASDDPQTVSFLTKSSHRVTQWAQNPISSNIRSCFGNPASSGSVWHSQLHVILIVFSKSIAGFTQLRFSCNETESSETDAGLPTGCDVFGTELQILMQVVDYICQLFGPFTSHCVSLIC